MEFLIILCYLWFYYVCRYQQAGTYLADVCCCQMQSLLCLHNIRSCYANVLGHLKLHSVLERRIHSYKVFMANFELVLNFFPYLLVYEHPQTYTWLETYKSFRTLMATEDYRSINDTS